MTTSNDKVPEDWQEITIDGFATLIGPILRLKREDNSESYALRTRDKHKNQLGLVHGGVLTSMLDQVIAITAWKAADRQPVVTLQMDTRFLHAARPGDFLEANATIQHATRSLLFVNAQIICGETPIASASAIMKIASQSGNRT